MLHGKTNTFFLLFITIFVVFFIANYAKAAEDVWQIPDLQIKFSDNIFSQVQCETNSNGKKENCQVAWIYEYIVAIYKYAVGIVGIIAVLVMMWVIVTGKQIGRAHV